MASMSGVTVQFFASLREELGADKLNLKVQEAISVSELVRRIADQENAGWQSTLSASDILVAVNQTLVDRDHMVEPGDEVAFLPPVTGG
ncbi:MAG: molybdopterin synthase sulfur carrier subunit [Patiriisocius sp.]|jgi:molybdopterin synthase sulfur carrier subunit